MYPNPSNGNITVELLSYKSGILKIFVYSSTGTTRVETELEATAGIMLTQQFDFSAYAKGAYFFVARSEEESIEQRFLIE
ncbi:MAG: T9SS type A sorting domain-containing protein [Chitinophagaceae bacterium]|nr:T9SS type A sorting domain-containing protein [Chitinophagaceae bacterium]